MGVGDIRNDCFIPSLSEDPSVWHSESPTLQFFVVWCSDQNRTVEGLNPLYFQKVLNLWRVHLGSGLLSVGTQPEEQRRKLCKQKCSSPYLLVLEDCAAKWSMGILVYCFQVDDLSGEEIQARYVCHIGSLRQKGENGLKTSTNLCCLPDIWNPSLSSLLPQFCIHDTPQSLSFLTLCCALDTQANF